MNISTVGTASTESVTATVQAQSSVRPTPAPVSSSIRNSFSTHSILEKERLAKLAVQKAREQCFINGWRSFITSPLVIITIITHAIMVIINFAGIGDTLESMEYVSYLLGDFCSALLNIYTVGSALLGALLNIGMWMVYVDGNKTDNTLPSSRGLSLIAASVNINYIGSMVIFILFGMVFLGTTQDVTALGVLIGIIIAFIPISVIYRSIIIILNNTVRSFGDGLVSSEKVAGVGIFTIIIGCISSFSLFFQFTWATLLSSVFSILIGCVMISYKNTLEWIETEQITISKG